MKREFPDAPILCVGGVAIQNESVLLIRRGKEPQLGEWTLPGGMVELGEPIETGLRRELREETGLDVEPVEFLMIYEKIVRLNRRVRFHYVVADFLCRVKGGRLGPSSDVTDARWVRKSDLPAYHLRAKARDVVRRAFARASAAAT